MATFADLKAKRHEKDATVGQPTTAVANGSAPASEEASKDTMQVGELASQMMSLPIPSSTTSSQSTVLSSSIYKLDDALLEIRETPNAGRGLFAKKKISPGTVVMSLKPHLALLDKEHLPVLCSNCMRDRGRTLMRCSGCAAVWYCSTECQRAQWKPLLHKLECTKLKQWATTARKAGVSGDREIPDTPIRAIGNLLMLKEHMPKEWWAQVQAMAGSPRTLTPTEQEQQGTLAVAITHYIGSTASPTTSLSAEASSATSALVSIFPEFADDTTLMTRALLDAVDKFSINSFSLTDIDLTNLGVAINPPVALINHSCLPNCSVVFPNGPRGEMKVIAVTTVEAGQELLSSYLDLTMPIQKRQQELLEQYKFECVCPACEEGKRGNELRRSVECAKSGCSGYVPLPGRAEMVGVKEIPCNQCQTTRRIRLGAEKDPKTGIIQQGVAYLIDAANELLPKLTKQAGEEVVSLTGGILGGNKDVDHSLALKKCLALCKEHHLTPYSYPYLALNRYHLESVLISATAGPGSTTNYKEARQLSRLVLSGLSTIYPPGHPVRAVQQVMLARLLSIGENYGEEITDIPNLRVAYEQMKIAYGEVRVAFGKDGDMVRDTERGLKGLERDIAWRETARRNLVKN